MKKKSLPLSEVYKHLEPGPVVLLTTSLNGKPNVMTMSWHTMMDFTPPLIGCIVSDKNYTFQILKKTKECVINIPTVEIAKKVVGIGNTSGNKIDKFKKFDLLQEPAMKVNTPLLKECYVSLECKVVDMRMAKKYNLFVVEVVKAWVRPRKTKPKTIHHCGKGVFIVDGNLLRLPSKMK